MFKTTIVAALAASLAIAGCSKQQVDQCMQAQNPQECVQVRDAGGNVSDYLMYGLGGYMLGRMMTPSGPRYYMQPNPGYHGVRRPIASYNNSYRVVSNPSYRPYSAAHNLNVAKVPTKRVVTTTTTTTTKKGLFGSKTTTSTTRSSSSWGSSSSSRSSYRSSSSSSYRPSYSRRK